MKVKVIKLDDRYPEEEQSYEKTRIGQVFEAFRNYNQYADEGYQEVYALNVQEGVWFMPVQFCEVVEEGTTLCTDTFETKTTNNKDKILLVEDGSVDTDKLEEDGFYVIIYRQGSTPPMWLKSNGN